MQSKLNIKVLPPLQKSKTTVSKYRDGEFLSRRSYTLFVFYLLWLYFYILTVAIHLT